MNDGLEWVQDVGWWIVDASTEGITLLRALTDVWMPPLYPHVWLLQRGVWDKRKQQVRLATVPRPIKSHHYKAEVWGPVLATGTWSELWPVMLAYIAMIGEEDK